MPKDHSDVTDSAGPHDTMRGVSRRLRDILDELEAAPQPQPDPAPHADRAAAPDPAARGATASLGDLLNRLDERGFGLVMLLLALPTSIPFVYVLPQIIAVPMLALAAQMAMGRHAPWLPAKLRARRFEIHRFRSVLDLTERYVRLVEHFARPRLAPVTGRLGARIVGGLFLAPLISVLIPLPATNAVPAAGVAIASLGLIERDGLLVIAGLLVSFVWIALLLAFGVEAASIVKDWLSSMF